MHPESRSAEISGEVSRQIGGGGLCQNKLAAPLGVSEQWRNGTGRFGRMEEVAKLFYGLAVIFSILMVVFVTFGGQGFWIAISASVLGVFGFGMYPIALELSVLDHNHFHHISH